MEHVTHLERTSKCKESTKTALLEAGKRLFLERGFSEAGLELILQQAGVPKGSFYYYFTSKEDFGLQVIDRFARHCQERLELVLNDPSLSPLNRVRRHFEEGIACLASEDCRSGCLIGRLSQELADRNERFRLQLEQIFGDWSSRLAACLRQAQQHGEVDPHLDPQQLAEIWINGWQGAVLRAKTARSTGPLHQFLDWMIAQARPRPAEPDVFSGIGSPPGT
jgi:TetR/AcrR family transcriptional repressor of nem operon